jgi:acetyl esterase/lipase
MNVSKIVFTLSDYIHHPLRNYKRYTDVVVEKNIPFDTCGNETSLDVYYPKFHVGNLAVLVNVHGGGFVRGDKKFRSGIAKFFASNGYFVINTNYRLAPKTLFPAPSYDTVTALNFINTLGDRYPIDLTKIIVMGDSAGGYYAAHAVTSTVNEGLRAKLDLPVYKGEKILGLLTFCTPFDLMRCFTTKTPLNVTVDVTNCVFGTNYKTNEVCQNFKYGDELNVLKWLSPEFPQILAIAADHDSLCGGQIEAAEQAFKEAGVNYEIYIAKEKGDSHCTHLLPYKKGTGAQLNKALRWLSRIIVNG